MVWVKDWLKQLRVVILQIVLTSRTKVSSSHTSGLCSWVLKLWEILFLHMCWALLVKSHIH